MTIKEAADNLYSKNKITSEEYNTILNLEKTSGIGGLFGKAVKNINSPKQLSPWVSTLGLGTGAGVLGYNVKKELGEELSLKREIKNSYQNLKKKTPQLKNYSDEDIKDYFEVVRTFSPKSASNPLVAGALVNKMLEFGGVDHKLIQDISNIQSEHNTLDELAKVTAKGIMGGA